MLRLMMERFLDGLDAGSVDYAAIDNDWRLDANVDALQDAQDAWFEDDGA
jgi:hypothetical protein